MNIIRATGRLLSSTRFQFKSVPSVRGAIYLDKDWQPGPYPKTEAERLAAAKKYNLLPEEYQAYDPEKWEFAYGDYPQLPNRSFWEKDQYYAYDYPAYNHNYGEVYHINDELYGFSGLELNAEENVSLSEIFWVYFVVCGITLIYCLLVHNYERVTILKPFHRIHPGEVYYHYPNSNLKAYEEHEH